MQSHDFLFALELSDERRFETLLSEVAGAVLTHVGFAAPAIDEIRQGLRTALVAGASNGRTHCDVRFRAQGGELQITVACAGSVEWRTSRPLP